MDRLMLKIKKIGFPLTALFLFVATADGIGALLNAHFLDVWSWALALSLAAVVDAVLISALLDWLKTRRLVALSFMLLFMGVSGAASINFWYRQIRGSEKTVELFNLERDNVLQGLVTLRDRLAEAGNGLANLAEHSKKMAKREVEGGDTCERQTQKKPGPRQRFRDSDAMFFEGLNKDLEPIPPRLDTEIAVVRGLAPNAGPTLIEADRRIKQAATTASSIVNDPALGHIVSELRRRVAEDQNNRVDGRTTFNCADSTVRTLAGTAIARIEKLPKMRPIVIVDWSKPGGGLGILPLLVNFTTWGTPGGLSGVDAIVVLLAVLVELALVWTARGVARAVPPERVLPHLQCSTSEFSDGALAFVRELSRAPDPEIRELAEIIERYRIRFLLVGDVIVVSVGSNDARAQKLEWLAPILVAVGWARRTRMLPNSMFRAIAWWRWKETRGCQRRDVFRLDIAAMDELRLAEVLSRMRNSGTAGGTPSQDESTS